MREKITLSKDFSEKQRFDIFSVKKFDSNEPDFRAFKLFSLFCFFLTKQKKKKNRERKIFVKNFFSFEKSERLALIQKNYHKFFEVVSL